MNFEWSPGATAPAAVRSANSRNEPDIVALPDGGFVTVRDDDRGDSVLARACLASGATDGAIFIVNGTETDVGAKGEGRVLFTRDDQSGDIEASIRDPRTSRDSDSDSDSEDYATVPLNVVSADVVTGGPGASTMQGDGGSDTLIGPDFTDSIDVEGGNDPVQGGSGQ